MQWYLAVLKKYAVFDGRASRSEYWWYVLFNVIFAVAAMIIDNVLGLAMKNTAYGPFYLVYVLATLIPGLAVLVRRLHDTGKSGWYILMGMIPCIGGIILLVFTVAPGDTGDNEYGPDPWAYS